MICCSLTFIHQCVRLYLCLGHANNPLKAVCESGLRDFDLLSSKHCPHLWSFRAGGVKCFFKVCCFVFFLLRGPHRGCSVTWAWSSIFHGLITGSLHDLNKKQRRWCYNQAGSRLQVSSAGCVQARAATLCQTIKLETDFIGANCWSMEVASFSILVPFLSICFHCVQMIVGVVEFADIWSDKMSGDLQVWADDCLDFVIPLNISFTFHVWIKYKSC